MIIKHEIKQRSLFEYSDNSEFATFPCLDRERVRDNDRDRESERYHFPDSDCFT